MESHRGSSWDDCSSNICINNLDSRIKGTLTKFADDTKLSSAADTAEGRNAIQWNLGKLESLVRFNKAKYKELHLDHSNPRYVYRPRE